MSLSFRTLFLGTPDFAGPSLETLVGNPFYDVVGVVTQPIKRPGFSRSRKTFSFIEELIKKRKWEDSFPLLNPLSVNSPEVLKEIRCLKGDLAVVVAFGQILSQEFLDLFSGQVFNLHASLLPRWRGAAPIQRAILSGDTQTGISLQKIERGLDTGPLLGERQLKLTEEKDARMVHDELKILAQDLLLKELKDYLKGFLEPKAQSEFIKKGKRDISYAHKIQKSEAFIDWKHSAEQISRKIRAFSLHSGAISWRKGKRFKIHRASFDLSETLPNFSSVSSSFFPGEVVKVETDAFWLRCGKGHLRVLEVQPESRSRMPARDFLKGYDLKLKEIFE